MTEIVSRVMIIFAMIAIGYIVRGTGAVAGEVQKPLSALLLKVNIPCMLIYSITQKEIDDALMVVTLQTLGLSAAFFALAALISVPVAAVMRFRTAKEQGVCQAVFVTSNAGFMGFPVAQMLFGSDVFYCMVLFNIVMNFYLYSVCLVKLGGGSIRQMIRPSGLRKMANICMISAVISVILLFAGVHLPAFVNAVIGPVGDASIPMAMLLIGIQLADGRILEQIRDLRLAVLSLTRMFLWPLLMLLIVLLLPSAVTVPVKIVLVLGAALPPASTISVLAANEGGDEQLASGGLVITTALSVLSIPLFAMLAQLSHDFAVM